MNKGQDGDDCAQMPGNNHRTPLLALCEAAAPGLPRRFRYGCVRLPLVTGCVTAAER